MTIYISPFWVGVITTIAVELAALVGYTLWLGHKKKEDKRWE